MIVQARHVTRTLENEAVPVTLVRDADVEVQPGEFIAITGPSGSGKSSLLYLLGLLDHPTAGEIFIEGGPTVSLSEETLGRIRLEKLGFVFQFHFLLPEFTAAENVMMPMRRLGTLNEKQILEKSLSILSDLGLHDQSYKLPSQMSGGQRQRVAIARALANDPILILADEPTGNLDSVSSQTVQNILKDMAHLQNRAVLAVTHDTDFAKGADRIIHIVDGKIT